MMKFKLAALAAAALFAAPASATLVTYDVIAGGAGASWGEHSVQSCTYTRQGQATCNTVMNATDANFDLAGHFAVDTEKLPADTDGNANRMYFSKSDDSFVTASITKTGGTMALPTATSDGGDRSIMYSNGSTYQLYGQTSASYNWTNDAYHDNGYTAQRSSRDQFIDIFLYTPGITTSVIDDADFATSFGGFNVNSFLRSFDRINEQTFDTMGRLLTSTMTTKYVYGRIQSIDTGPAAVAEPAALALFGLGAAAVGLRRRRRRTA